MKRLLKIEYLKVKNYSTFWWILGIYAVLVPTTFISLSRFDFPLFPSTSEIFGFPTVWNYITYMASWWNIVLGVLIVILTCNDVSYKTQRQSVIDGLSRKELIAGKIYFLIVLALCIAVYTLIIGVIIGSIFSNPLHFYNGLEFVLIYFVQALGYFVVAFFIAVLIQKSALAIIIFILIIMLDGLLKWALGTNIAQFFPTIIISDLTPFPFLDLDAITSSDRSFELSNLIKTLISSLYIIMFMFFSYRAIKKRDL